MLPVPEPIPGTAFFPGGYGLWRPDRSKPLPEFPVGGIMVLGHDFHSEAGYKASLARGQEAESQPTWRQLKSLLEEAHIDPRRCFFTNVFLGLRAGSGTTGPFPGANDPVVVDHCVTFLGEQIATQQPRLIVTLGINVPPLLGRLAVGLEPWTRGRGLKFLDAAGPVQTRIEFKGSAAVHATVVALTHPSLRHASVRHRRYGGEIGHAAEVTMLGDALDMAGP